jgi:hypothetical protein
MPLGDILFRYGLQDDLQEQFGTGQPVGAQGLQVGSPQTLSTGSSLAGANISVAVLSSVGFTVGTWAVVDTVASGLQETQLINAIPDATHIQFATLKNAHTTPFPIAANIFTTPAGVSGPPPFTGITQLTAVTAPRPKGILFKAIYPVYQLTTAAQTTNTIGLTKTTFANVTAPVVTNIIANANNGLAVATNAQPYVTPIPVPVASQVYQTSRFTEYVIEWDITPSGATAIALLFGIFIDVSYNLN